MSIKDAIWVEKYRPQTLEDLVSPPKGLLELVRDCKATGKKMPSMIFSSSAGTGKTSTALVIAKYLDCDYIKINSSDERGVESLRDNVKSFARTESTNGKQKCIVCDESDGMHYTALDALRGLLETYHDNCFFIFTCNDPSKLREPVTSRCMTFQFLPPAPEAVKARLRAISVQESVKISEELLDKLVATCYTDIRSMVKQLQKFHITGEANFTTEETFNTVLKYIRSKNFLGIYQLVWSDSFDMSGFTKWMLKYTFDNYDSIDKTAISAIVYELASIEKSFGLGANKEIVFINALVQIGMVM